MKERRDVQKTILEYLARVWEEKEVVSLSEIREELDLTVSQVKNAKMILVSKGLAVNPGTGLLRLNQSKPSRKHYCALLTKKSDELRHDEYYCPLKRTFFADRDHCGKVLCVRFIESEPELRWVPKCKNWVGK